jgi:hypothetical protein
MSTTYAIDKFVLPIRKLSGKSLVYSSIRLQYISNKVHSSRFLLGFCFVCLRLVYTMLPVSQDCVLFVFVLCTQCCQCLWIVFVLFVYVLCTLCCQRLRIVFVLFAFVLCTQCCQCLCVVFCLSSSCVFYVASVSGLSIFDCIFGIL